jgi:Leucine-rich repeat (LRR) protein
MPQTDGVVHVRALYWCHGQVTVGYREPVLTLSRTAAAGLRELYMTSLQMHKLSFEAIRSCVKLEKLSVCELTVDLSPLAGCAQLQEISLDDCSISDLSPLGACAHLKKLSLTRIRGLDLNQLQGCAAQLHELNISGSWKLSLEGIQACGKLQLLNMACTSVESLAPLSACALLKKANLRGTTVTSVEPLQACEQLEVLTLLIGRRDPPGLAALEAALPRLRIEKVN